MNEHIAIKIFTFVELQSVDFEGYQTVKANSQLWNH